MPRNKRAKQSRRSSSGISPNTALRLGRYYETSLRFRIYFQTKRESSIHRAPCRVKLTLIEGKTTQRLTSEEFTPAFRFIFKLQSVEPSSYNLHGFFFWLCCCCCNCAATLSDSSTALRNCSTAVTSGAFNPSFTVHRQTAGLSRGYSLLP
jgi:hypothetical protein